MTDETTTPEAVQVTPTAVTPAVAAPEDSILAPATPVATEASSPPEDFDWKSHLSDEFKEEKSLQDIKDIDGLAKSYVNQSKLIGKKVEEMTPEEMGKYSSKMGRPDTAQAYDITNESVAESKGDIDWFKVSAHKAGLSNDQANNLMDDFMEHATGIQNAQGEVGKETSAKQVAELKEEFGYDFESNVGKANQALAHFGGDDLLNDLKAAGLGNHPGLVKAFYGVSNLMGEHKTVSDGSAPVTGKTQQSLHEEIMSLRKDEKFNFQYNNPNDPQAQQQARDKLESLYLQKSNLKK